MSEYQLAFDQETQQKPSAAAPSFPQVAQGCVASDDAVEFKCFGPAVPPFYSIMCWTISALLPIHRLSGTNLEEGQEHSEQHLSERTTFPMMPLQLLLVLLALLRKRSPFCKVTPAP